MVRGGGKKVEKLGGKVTNQEVAFSLDVEPICLKVDNSVNNIVFTEQLS